jgi:large subunit ribosomal protein L32
MAVPKRKVSKQRKATRKANWKLETPVLTECTHCHTLIVPHKVCGSCGYYKGKEVIKTETK